MRELPTKYRSRTGNRLRRTVTRGQIRKAGWIAASGRACLAVVATIPYARYRSPYYMDNWDLVYDLISRPWADYVLRPTVSGHFFPVFKAVYGLCVRLGGFELEILLARDKPFIIPRTSSLNWVRSSSGRVVRCLRCTPVPSHLDNIGCNAAEAAGNQFA